MPMTRAAHQEADVLRLKRLGIDTYQELVAFVARSSPVCRSEGWAAQSRVDVTCAGRSIIATLDEAPGAVDPGATGAAALRLSTVVTIAELGTLLLPIARRGRATVLERASAAAEQLKADERAATALEVALAKARTDAAGWHTPLAPDDARAALAIATAKEGSFLRFLDGGWRRVDGAPG